jgi:hypothetical protein
MTFLIKQLTKPTTLPHILNPKPSILTAPPVTADTMPSVGVALCLAVLLGRDVDSAPVVDVATRPESIEDSHVCDSVNTLEVVAGYGTSILFDVFVS